MQRQHGKVTITTLILSVVLMGVIANYWMNRTPEAVAAGYKNLDGSTRLSPRRAVPDNLGHIWPPQLGEPFPDLYLYSNKGKKRLSDFRGKVILVEPIGMNCPACNAFNGGNGVAGGYSGTTPQKGLNSIEDLLSRHAQITLDDPNIILVHLLLYNMNFKTPSEEDAHQWAKHFNWEGRDNVYVMVGDARYINKVSYDMIPGFYLIDRDFILRSDSTGHRPKNGLVSHLIAMIPELIAAAPASESVSYSSSVSRNTPLLQALTVDEAYRKIPHRRTEYQQQNSTISEEEAAYLQQLFNVVDNAVVERVATLGSILGSEEAADYEKNYLQILTMIQSRPVPLKARPAHRLIEEAIREQSEFLAQWENQGSRQFERSHPLVQSSHRKLYKAYQLLMAAYPGETQHNKQAFFDYLCALDFI